MFLGTHLNRVDAKGRISIPAFFRNALKSTADYPAHSYLILRPSHRYSCIEGWPPAVFSHLSKPLDSFDLFSNDQEDFATTLYADAYPVEADREGRIILPNVLKVHARIDNQAVFVGLGRIFQIWEPVAAEKRRLEARKRSRQLVLPASPSLAEKKS